MAVTRTKGTSSKEVVINHIVVRAPFRHTQNIEKWRNAIRSFENVITPIRLHMYDLYDDISLDGQIESTWGKRLDGILNKELVFLKPDGTQDEMINKLLNSPDMRAINKELLNSLVWGYTLLQINNIVWDDMEERWRIDFDLIPRKHVHPEKNFKCISIDQCVPTVDFLYQEDPLVKYMLWAGDPTDKGLYCKAAQYVIYKRGGFGDWAQFAEMFGMPFREAAYDDYDDNTRIKLEQAMEQWGGANYMIRPKGAEIKIHDTGGSSGSNTIYKDLKDSCNTEISKIMLGNTLTTEEGNKGTKALGTVHEKSEDQKHLSDEKFIIQILNSKFRAILKTFGVNISGGAILFKDDETDWNTMLTKWQVYQGVSQQIPVSDETIYEEFDIPKPANYDELKEKMEQKTLNPFAMPLQQPLNPDQNNNVTNILKRFFG
jgi:hypothetical protein